VIGVLDNKVKYVSTLYVVSTPIGNLEDITLRALRILKEVDFVLCEDTRVTQKLLSRYGISTPTISYHQHSTGKKVEYVLDLLNKGKNLALVCDAGTPGISDPGGKLIQAAIEQHNNGTIVTVPGPSALTAAASISGFPMDRFEFKGFPPQKKKRKKFFEEIAQSKQPVIFYESSHRIIKSLLELKEMDENMSGFAKSRAARQVVLCRELTKKFETVYRGIIGEVIRELEGGEARGEFVVVVEGRKNC